MYLLQKQFLQPFAAELKIWANFTHYTKADMSATGYTLLGELAAPITFL